jgi:UDPglucose 6-dehydrogenase
LEQQRDVTLAITSTVLPGRTDREIRPLINPRVSLCYNPPINGSETVTEDYVHPEFVVIGCDEPGRDALLADFYASLHNRPIIRTSVKTAEVVKVAHSAFIGVKHAFADVVMEMCDKLGADCDGVTRALQLADRAVVGPDHLSSGMGEGGGEHLRENIAMSGLAEELALHHDLFADIVRAREDHIRWLAVLIFEHHYRTGLPVIVLGKGSSPGSTSTEGSPALLLATILRERHHAFLHVDPELGEIVPLDRPALFFIATNHPAFATLDYPSQSLILDPWRSIPARADIQVIAIGKPQ